MEFQILVEEGVALAERLKHEISFMRSYYYTQSSIDILQTASLYLDSAVDLLNYADELHLKKNDAAAEKVQIASDAIKKVAQILMREFDTNVQDETEVWFNKVSTTVGVNSPNLGHVIN